MYKAQHMVMSSDVLFLEYKNVDYVRGCIEL